MFRGKSLYGAHAWRAALAFCAVLGVSQTGVARAADEGAYCGRFASWSEQCAPGLNCDIQWSWGPWQVGECVQPAPAFCGGLLGLQCPDQEFCNYAPDANCGRADMTGTCEPQPSVCTHDYRPVCGCDGKTYSNVCTAQAAGVSVESEGACDECYTDDDCSHGYCDSGVTCLASECPPSPPSRCTVCGDGSDLRCRMALKPCPDGQVREIVDSCYGACVDRYTCEPVPEGCDVDGVTYEVGETFGAADGCNECTCSEGGLVACTEKACACNFDDGRDWVMRDPELCSRVRFMCGSENRPFFNECGCGCEPVPEDDCRLQGCVQEPFSDPAR